MHSTNLTAEYLHARARIALRHLYMYIHSTPPKQTVGVRVMAEGADVCLPSRGCAY